MTASEQLYEKLKAELEDLKQLADKQTHLYKSSRDLLYEGLSKVYMWWQQASKDEALLHKLYDEYDLQYKAKTIHAIAFSPLLRYLWNMNGTVNSNTIDIFNRALNAVHIAVQNNKEFYKTNTLEKLISFISTSGGATALAAYCDDQQKPNNTVALAKLSKTAAEKLNNAHLASGKAFFANNATAFAQFKSKSTLANTDGFSLALVRKNSSGYEVISTINDRNLVEQAVVAAYKRTSEKMPNTARLLTEIIRTQTLPSKIAKLAAALTDDSKYAEPQDGGKHKMKQLKRLLYKGKDGVFVLSANRGDCSVVTVAKPFATILDTDKDVALGVRERTYIENNLIHSGDFNFYTADAAQYVPATENEEASHKLKLENTITKKFKFIRFYRLSTFNFPPSKTQAVVKVNAEFKTKYTAKLSNAWLAEMNAKFLARWIDGFGAKIKRNEHTIFRLALAKSFIAFSFNYKANDFKETELVDLDSSAKAKGILDVLVLSKDIVPVLNALMHLEINNDVTLEADDKMLRFSFATDCADYSIAIPCCTNKAKRIGDYFEAYGDNNDNQQR